MGTGVSYRHGARESQEGRWAVESRLCSHPASGDPLGLSKVSPLPAPTPPPLEAREEARGKNVARRKALKR